MRIGRVTAGLATAALLAGMLTAGAAGSAVAGPKGSCAWRLVAAPDAPRQLVVMDSVTPLGEDDVFLGGYGYYPSRPWTLHWDGTSVSEGEQVPLAPLMSAVGSQASFSSADEGWMLLSQTGFDDAVPLVERWHDGRWTMTPTALSPEPKTTAVSLTTVQSLSEDDAWAFGSLWKYSTLGRTGSVIEHWDGTSWSMVPNARQTRESTYLSGVAALSPSDIWAVGQQSDSDGNIVPLVQHWDGERWTVVPAPAGNGPSALYGVSASGTDDIWAVGAQTKEGTTNLAVPLVEHWDGTSWTEVRGLPDVSNGRLDDVYAAGPDAAWAIVEVPRGAFQFLHWDGEDWSVTQGPGPQALRMRYFYGAIGGTGPDDVWAVGEVTNQTTATGTVQIAHYSCGRRSR